MDKDIFHDRGRAEEAAYFRQQDARLLEKLRERAKLSEIVPALAEKLKVDHPQLLERIGALGVTRETGAAFLLSPLVFVAWADGHVTREEQAVVLRFAHERGVTAGSTDETQIVGWLGERPPNAMFDAALEAIALGLTVMPREEAEERVAKMMRACREVAEVSEGMTKLWHEHSLVTPEERRTLDAIWVALSCEGRGRAGGTPPGEGDHS